MMMLTKKLDKLNTWSVSNLIICSKEYAKLIFQFVNCFIYYYYFFFQFVNNCRATVFLTSDAITRAEKKIKKKLQNVG